MSRSPSSRLASIALSAVLAGMAAACDTVSAVGPRVAVAEVESADNPAASVNLASLTEVVNRRPNDPEAFNQRGAAYARLGRFNEAIADFSRAVSLDASFAPALTNRGLAQRQSGRDDAALQDFSRAIEANPNYAPAYLARGNLLRARNQLPEAIADLNQAIRLNPEGAEALHARGLVQQRQGNHRAAVADFDAAIDRNPYNAPPYTARGQSLLQLGQFAKAQEDFTASLNVDNRNPDAWAGLGMAQERQGANREAQESYQRRSPSTTATRWRAPESAGSEAGARAAAASSAAADGPVSAARRAQLRHQPPLQRGHMAAPLDDRERRARGKRRHQALGLAQRNDPVQRAMLRDDRDRHARRVVDGAQRIAREQRDRQEGVEPAPEIDDRGVGRVEREQRGRLPRRQPDRHARPERFAEQHDPSWRDALRQPAVGGERVGLQAGLGGGAGRAAIAAPGEGEQARAVVCQPREATEAAVQVAAVAVQVEIDGLALGRRPPPGVQRLAVGGPIVTAEAPGRSAAPARTSVTSGRNSSERCTANM